MKNIEVNFIFLARFFVSLLHKGGYNIHFVYYRYTESGYISLIFNNITKTTNSCNNLLIRNTLQTRPQKYIEKIQIRKYGITYIISLILLFIAICPSYSNSLNNLYTQFNKLDIDSLYTMGMRYNNTHCYDTALVCFSICGSRAHASMPSEKKSICVKALTLSARLYFKFYDYGKACSLLVEAIKLCNEEVMEKNLTGVYMEQGALMMTYAQQRPKEHNFQQGEEAYRKAFWNAIKHKQYTSATTAFINLGSHLYRNSRLDEFTKELKHFDNIIFSQDDPLYDYVFHFHQGLCHVAKQDYQQAYTSFQQQVATAPPLNHNILKYKAYANIAQLFTLCNEIDSAICYETKMYNLALSTHMKDGIAVAATDLASLYEAIGDSVNASHYAIIALQQKDSLLTVNNLDEVNSLNFVQQLLEEEKRVKEYDRKNRRLTIGIILLTIIAIASALYFLKTKKNKHAASNILPPHTIEQDTEVVKYKNSSLEENAKQEIREKINHVLNETDAIYQQDFCLDKLAELCNSKPKYISQVINELYGQNFTTLINSLRIQEVCHRMTDKDNFGTLTLEAIAQSVGFKNRVTFYQAFKKFKGITPSQYMQNKE